MKSNCKKYKKDLKRPNWCNLVQLVKLVKSNHLFMEDSHLVSGCYESIFAL